MRSRLRANLCIVGLFSFKLHSNSSVSLNTTNHCTLSIDNFEKKKKLFCEKQKFLINTVSHKDDQETTSDFQTEARVNIDHKS